MRSKMMGHLVATCAAHNTPSRSLTAFTVSPTARYGKKSNCFYLKMLEVMAFLKVILHPIRLMFSTGLNPLSQIIT